MKPKGKGLVERLISPFRSAAAKRTAAARADRMVWRMTQENPKGGWIDPNVPTPPAPTVEVEPLEANSSGWLTSSMDLMSGAEISEHTLDPIVPDEDPPARKPKSPRSS